MINPLRYINTLEYKSIEGFYMLCVIISTIIIISKILKINQFCIGIGFIILGFLLMIENAIYLKKQKNKKKRKKDDNNRN